MHEKEMQLLKDRLEDVHKNGVELFLEGEPSSPGEIAGKCISEENIYMADYVLDDVGVLRQLRYDKVSRWK